VQIRLFWNNWSSMIKNHNIDQHLLSIFITELEFLIKNDFQSKMKNSPLFNFDQYQGMSFLFSNSSSVMEIESKCWSISCSNYSKINKFA